MHVTTRAQLEYVCGLFPCVFVFPDNLLAVWQGSIPVFNFAHHVRECWTRDDIRCKTDPFFSCHKFLTKIRYFIFGITCCRSHLANNRRRANRPAVTLETSSLETLYGGQFTLLTQFIKPNCLLVFLRSSTTVSLKLTTLFICRLLSFVEFW